MPDPIPLKTLAGCIAGKIVEGVDWDAVIAAANRTLTTGTMAERLLELTDGIKLPDDVRIFLTEIRNRAIERNRRLLAQLEEAVAQLSRFDVQPLLIKGAALLCQKEAGPFQARLLSDLDLMIPPSSFSAAVRALRDIGYAFREPEPHSSSLPVVLYRPQDAGTIDLHRRLKCDYPSPSFDLLLQGARSIPLGEVTAWLPSPTMQSLILILHDQLQERDYWRGLVDLRHLFDIDSLAKSPPGLDWRQLAALFPPGYPQSALRTQLLTLSKLLETAIPADLYRGWRPALQYRRRMLQSKWPALMRPATMLSLLLDPPIKPTRAAAPAGGNRPDTPSLLARTGRGLRRFARSKGLGKI